MALMRPISADGAADYIDLVLKGEKLTYQSAEQSIKIGLVINTQTAKVLGLEIPPSLRSTTDDIIE